MNALAQVFPKLFGPPLELQDEIAWVRQMVQNTPDIGKLEQYEFQLLFSPDETQRGYPQYPLIEDSAFVCHGFTQKPYSFWQQRDRQVIPMEAGPEHAIKYFPPPLKVKGEVHAIRPYQFIDLDNFKGNTVQYVRKRVKLIVPYREVVSEEYGEKDLPLALQGKKGALSPEKVVLVRAWMYVGNPEYWDSVLNTHTFKAVQTHKSRVAWRQEYYSYPKREITG